MIVTAIAAHAHGRVIGTGDGIPWHLPADIEHFRAYTAGKALLLGRSTFMEMLGWFRTHRPIVLTRDTTFTSPKAAAVVSTVADAVAVARGWGEPELVVTGGASTYVAALPLTDQAVLTEIDARFEGAATFPELDPGEWQVTSNISHPKSPENPYSFSVVTYRRTAPFR